MRQEGKSAEGFWEGFSSLLKEREALSMQETWVQPLVWEEPLSPCAITAEPELWRLGAATTEPMLCKKGSHLNERPVPGN